MSKHHLLTAPKAIHPFAFRQGTDPSLVTDNNVLPGKAWIDTSNSNALKVRNEANNGWITVLGASSLSLVWNTRVRVYDTDVFYDESDTDFETRTYTSYP